MLNYCYTGRTSSLIDVYATIPNIAPSAITAAAGTCTVTFEANMFYKFIHCILDPKFKYKITVADVRSVHSFVQIENLITGEKKKIQYSSTYNNSTYTFGNFVLRYIAPYWKIYTKNGVPMLYSKDAKKPYCWIKLRICLRTITPVYIGTVN